jgi:subtilisin family serine protease
LDQNSVSLANARFSQDFEGRATFAANFADTSDTDGHGHGTHVAGTIGSKTYGVAKKTLLYGVKVIDDDGKGTTSSMIKGLDFVVADAPKRNCPKGVVANMSLRDNVSVALNAAAAALTTNDIFLAVSAGNQSQDASTQSPASEPTVCTIGASGITDQLSYYSNFGAVVDVFAPGDGIDSLAPGGKTVSLVFFVSTYIESSGTKCFIRLLCLALLWPPLMQQVSPHISQPLKAGQVLQLSASCSRAMLKMMPSRIYLPALLIS